MLDKRSKGILGKGSWVVLIEVAVLICSVVSRSVAQSPVSTAGTLYATSVSFPQLLGAFNLSTLTLSTTLLPAGTPVGIACGPDDGVYMALSGDPLLFGGPRQIVRFDRSLSLSSQTTILDFGFLPPTHPLFTSGGPQGPSFGPSKELFFNTTAPHTGVWRLPALGSVVPVPVIQPFITTPTLFFGFVGNATAFEAAPKLGFARNLLALDNAGGRIVRAAPDFAPMPPQPAVDFAIGLDHPSGIAVNSAGDIFVAESLSGLIKRFTFDGTPLPPFANLARFTDLSQIAFDANDNLYVGQGFTEGTLVITPAGVVSFLTGDFFTSLTFAVCPSVVISIMPPVISLGGNPTAKVTIVSGPSFDATKVIERASLTFGQTGNEASVISCAADGGTPPNLVCKFSPKLAFQVNDLMGFLRGRLRNGTWFQATAAVSVVP